MPTGRFKEFETNSIEIQEGGEAEFVVADDSRSIYVKNVTTGISEIVESTYLRPEFLSWIGIAGVVVIIYGIYKIKEAHGFSSGLAGFGIIALSLIIIAATVFMFKKRIASLDADFQKKVLATGVSVEEFKTPSVI